MLFLFFFFFFLNTNANTWRQSYNASTFLVIRNLIERQKNHIIFCQFSSKNVWMVGGNLSMTGSGLPAARPQVRLSNTWTHLDTQMPYFMLQSRPKQARKCSLCLQCFFFFLREMMKFVLEMANMLQIVLAQSSKGHSATGTPKPVKILGRKRRCQCPR